MKPRKCFSLRAVQLARVLAVATAVAAAGCGSAPPPRFHSLLGSETVVPGERPDAARHPGPPGAFILEPIRMPASVDQPQWLVRMPDDSLASLESERWASPLRDEFRQAVLVELAGRYRLVDARDDRTVATTAWRVRIEVLRFESIAGREARIEGTWTLIPPLPAVPLGAKPLPRQPDSHCSWRYAEPVSSGMQALAAAHRKNVMRLADAIGESLTRLQRGELATCASD